MALEKFTNREPKNGTVNGVNLWETESRDNFSFCFSDRKG